MTKDSPCKGCLLSFFIYLKKVASVVITAYTPYLLRILYKNIIIYSTQTHKFTAEPDKLSAGFLYLLRFTDCSDCSNSSVNIRFKNVWCHSYSYHAAVRLQFENFPYSCDCIEFAVPYEDAPTRKFFCDII